MENLELYCKGCDDIGLAYEQEMLAEGTRVRVGIYGDMGDGPLEPYPIQNNAVLFDLDGSFVKLDHWG